MTAVNRAAVAVDPKLDPAISVGQVMMRLLKRYGVDTVFGIPGVHTLELYRGIAAESMNHVLVRHEQGAGFMADGYARVTGRPGVCTLITGPGLTNALTPIGQAFSDSIPMLVISSVNATTDLGRGWGRLHEITDQAASAAPLVGLSRTAYDADQVAAYLAEAFALWNKAGGRVLPGLVRRRAAEAALFLKPEQRGKRPATESPDGVVPTLSTLAKVQAAVAGATATVAPAVGFWQELEAVAAGLPGWGKGLAVAVVAGVALWLLLRPGRPRRADAASGSGR